MAFNFIGLKVWQISINLTNEIDIIAKNFPRIASSVSPVKLKKQQIL